MARRYWLMKSEPSVYSFEDLEAESDRTTGWDGVRNYQARNLMRDEMAVGDGVLFYHSNAKPPGVAGVAEVASGPMPDPTQFDPADGHFDPKADPEAPRWILVRIRAVDSLPRFVSLTDLKAEPRLEGMGVLQRGSRLSVQSVAPDEWRQVLKMGAFKGPDRGPR